MARSWSEACLIPTIGRRFTGFPTPLGSWNKPARCTLVPSSEFESPKSGSASPTSPCIVSFLPRGFPTRRRC